jgi:hypothetical protein
MISVQATYELPTRDQSRIIDFVKQVQAISDTMPSQVLENLENIMSRSRLTSRSYNILSTIKTEIVNDLWFQYWNGDKLWLRIAIPKTRSIDTGDTEYGVTLHAPRHDTVNSLKSISIYEINADVVDKTLDQHIVKTQQYYQQTLSWYITSGWYDTTIKWISAKWYRFDGTVWTVKGIVEGNQIVSLSGSKGITVTYMTTNGTYDTFYKTFENIKEQIK